MELWEWQAAAASEEGTDECRCVSEQGAKQALALTTHVRAALTCESTDEVLGALNPADAVS